MEDPASSQGAAREAGTMPRGSSPKREREARGRSEEKAEELAARTVNKQRREAGETKGSKSKG
jgi:hypothetical protein